MKHIKAIITAAFFALASVSCNPEMSQPTVAVKGVTLSPESINIEIGDQKPLTATVSPSDATNKNVSFTSSKESVATVSRDGIVEALAVGKAIVTVTTEDGKYKAHCTIEVTEGMGAVTGAATHISCRNAEISGKANLSVTSSTDLSFGILYSTSSAVLIGSATQIEARAFDSDYNYAVITEVLEPETTYYYRSYIIQDKEILYGELKSFKTLALSSMIQTLDATEINPKDAVLNAMLDLTDCKYDGLEYGFEVTPEGGSAHTIKSSNLSEKKFSVKDETLSRETNYSVVAYVKLDGRTYKGEVKEFTTKSIQASITAESSDVSYYSATIAGKLTVVSDGDFIRSAMLYYSNTARTLDALKSSGTKKTLTLDSDGSYSNNLSSLSENTQYNYVVVALIDDAEFNTDVKTFKTLGYLTPELVDLGLSVKWASFNLRASTPEEYGGYYQWAGLEDVTNTSIYLGPSNCPYHTGSFYESGWTKYIPANKPSCWSGSGSPDDKTILDPEDDVVHVKLGGKWRIPTIEEWAELRNASNCSWTWTSINGINGYIVQSKKEGYTDNFIFLPAAGHLSDNGVYEVGSYGYYWSSSLNTDYPYSARGLGFYSDVVNAFSGRRYKGLSVRPVSE